jgi:predicted alpha/beta superfamily hydrolase
MKFLPVAVLAILAASVGALASEPINIGETVKLHSSVLGEDRTILISTPARYARSVNRYPVLYMTDGDAHILHARGTVDFLARNGLMPDMIIVGITNTDRTRDLTPTRAANIQRDGSRVEQPTSGGAGKFLEFFEKELFPYVEANYRTAPFRVVAGHSLGGTFALHALVAKPELFGGFIAASPYLAWDENLPLRSVAEFFKDRKEFKKVLFVSMGNEEAGDPRPTRFEKLEKSLSKAKASGFLWESKAMPDETHGSVVLRSYYWGLRKVFEPWNLPADPRTGQFSGTVTEMEKHYAQLSERVGYKILPQEATVNVLGYRALGANDLKKAISIFQYNAGLYPESANVHDSLGEALERAGRLEEALASYENAVANERAADPAALQIYLRNRDRVAAALKGAKKGS